MDVVSYFCWLAKDCCTVHCPKHLKDFMSEDTVYFFRHLPLFVVFSMALESDKQMSYITSL